MVDEAIGSLVCSSGVSLEGRSWCLDNSGEVSLLGDTSPAVMFAEGAWKRLIRFSSEVSAIAVSILTDGDRSPSRCCGSSAAFRSSSEAAEGPDMTEILSSVANGLDQRYDEWRVVMAHKERDGSTDRRMTGS